MKDLDQEVVDTNIQIGSGEKCEKCGKMTLRYSHGADWRPKEGQALYYKYWDRCLDCRRSKYYEAVRLVEKSPPKQERKVPSRVRSASNRHGEFYKSLEWKRLRYSVLVECGSRCQCCGTTPRFGARIVVDHIRPVRKFWELRLDRDNLQVLCDECNRGKGSHDETDWSR